MNALADARGLPSPVVTQLLYNVLHRQLDVEYFAFARRYPIRPITYNALAGGLSRPAPLRGGAREGLALRREPDVPAALLDARRCSSASSSSREVARARGLLARRAGVRVGRVAARRRLDPRGAGDRRAARPRRSTPSRRPLSPRRHARIDELAREWAAPTRTTSADARRGGSRPGRRRPPSRTGARTGGRGSASRRARRRSSACARRADDIMLGPRRPRGPLLPARLGDGPLRGPRLRPRVGGPEPRVPEDREARARPALPRLAREPALRARRRAPSSATTWRSTARRSSPKGADGGTELPWHQDGGSFWGLDRDPELQIWTALDDAPVEAGMRRGRRRQPPRRASRRRSAGTSRATSSTRAAPTQRKIAAAGARRRGAPHPQLPVAPLGREHDGPPAARVHRLRTSARPRAAPGARRAPRTFVRVFGESRRAVKSVRNESRAASSPRSPSTSSAQDAESEHGLKRSLTALDLVMLGIGAIIGTGIFVLTGTRGRRERRPGGRAVVHRGGHRVGVRRPLLRRDGLDDPHLGERVHLLVRDDGRARRVDHRLGPDPRVPGRGGRRQRRLVGVRRRFPARHVRRRLCPRRGPTRPSSGARSISTSRRRART